jgi:hypothetical protein
MLMMKERRPPLRTIDGWARSALLEAGDSLAGRETGASLFKDRCVLTQLYNEV